MSKTKFIIHVITLLLSTAIIASCSSAGAVRSTGSSSGPSKSGDDYLVGPGDTLRVFVWRNPEISVTVPVRPEGKISTPLVEDMIAAGKSPTQLARDIEKVLSKYIKSPVVTVIVTDFVGTFGKQIRVVGQAANPRAIAYRSNMTLLDVMIEVGGLTEYAAGNKAKIIRRVGKQSSDIDVRIKDLMQKGNIKANIKMQPGDILIIPESWF